MQRFHLATSAICLFFLHTFATSVIATPAEDIAGKLVSLQGKNVSKFDDAPLGKAKFIAIYYSAAWCGPCRAFTPNLVSWYKENKSKYPQFEVVFVSHDNSEKEMEGYMKEDDMPWPALAYNRINSSRSIGKYAGPGIPCLVLVDDTGKVLSDSYENGTYVGPNKVLRDITRLLKDAPPAAPDAGASASSVPTTKVGSGKFDIFADKK